MWLAVTELDGAGLDNVANVDDNDDPMGFVSSSWSLKFQAQGAVGIFGTHGSWVGLEAKVFHDKLGPGQVSVHVATCDQVSFESGCSLVPPAPTQVRRMVREKWAFYR